MSEYQLNKSGANVLGVRPRPTISTFQRLV